MKVAVVQFKASTKKETNLKKILDYISKAAKNKPFYHIGFVFRDRVCCSISVVLVKSSGAKAPPLSLQI